MADQKQAPAATMDPSQDVNQVATAEDQHDGQAAEAHADRPFHVRIDLPAAPAAELVTSRPAEDEQASKASNKPVPTSMMAVCSPAEVIKDLKSLVTEIDGFWLGAFTFVRVPPTSKDAPATDQKEAPVGEYDDVGTIFSGEEYEDLSVPRILRVVPASFDDLESRFHVLRAYDIFTNSNPGLKTRQAYRGPDFDPCTLTLEHGICYSPLIRDQLQNKSGSSELTGSNSQKNNKAASKDQPQQGSSFAPFAAGSDAALKSFVDLRKQLAARSKAPLCVKSLALSAFNPPPQANRLRGQLLYLDLTTVEGEKLSVTSSTKGFYVDNSSPSLFDPTPRAGKNGSSTIYSSLFALLADRSPGFLTAMKEINPQQPPSHPDSLASAAILPLAAAKPWMVMPPQPSPNVFRTQMAFLAAGCTVPEAAPTARDWNDELVMTRELPKQTLNDKLNRERFFARIQSEMNDVAARAVVKIVQGEILPANPSDPPALQTVVHQNLLFVPAKDSLSTFSHLGGDEAVRQTVAKDVHNAQLINILDIDGLHLSPSVCIDFLGQRWFVQTVLPGLLGAGREAEEEEQESLEEKNDKEDKEAALEMPGFRVLYGSADTEKPERTYAAESSFEPLAKEVAKHLHLSEHEVYNTEGEASKLWLSGEIKGVLGQDNKKYLIDLYRLQPVDVNFLEKNIQGTLYSNPADKNSKASIPDADVAYPHRFALLRPELVSDFRQSQLHAWWLARAAERRKSREDGKKDEEETEEQAKQREIENLVETLKDSDNELKDFRFEYNPDAFVDRLDPQGGKPTDESDPATKHVREASDYLRKTALRNLLSEWTSNSSVPADGQVITSAMHNHGINMRYLGLVASESKVENINVSEKHVLHVERTLTLIVEALEREMVFRGAKHVLRQHMETLGLAEIPAFMSHYLNCLLGFGYNPSPQPDLSFVGKQAPRPSWASLTPQTVHQQIQVEIARRFRYALPASWFQTNLRKLQLLRELCLRCGVQVQVRDYQFERSAVPEGEKAKATPPQATNKSSKKNVKAPTSVERATTFDAEDVVQLYPVVKAINHKSTFADELFEQGTNALARGNIALGESCIGDAVGYYEQVFGNVHPELASKYHELANMYHQLSQPLVRNVQAYEISKHSTSEEDRKRAANETSITSEEDYAVAKRELQGFIDSAISMCRQSVVLTERTLGADSFKTALRFIDLGTLEHSYDNVKAALAYTRHAFEILEVIHGSSHPETIRAVLNAAQMVASSQGHAAAVPIYEQAVELAGKVRGPESIGCAAAILSLANAQAIAGRFVESKDCAKRAADIFAQRLGENDEKTQEANHLHQVLTRALTEREAGEKAKVERLARRLGLNEDRAKQLLERTSRAAINGDAITPPTAATPTASSSATPTETIDKAVDSKQRSAISNMRLEDVVDFIEGGAKSPSRTRPSKGKGPQRRKK